MTKEDMRLRNYLNKNRDKNIELTVTVDLPEYKSKFTCAGKAIDLINDFVTPYVLESVCVDCFLGGNTLYIKAIINEDTFN